MEFALRQRYIVGVPTGKAMTPARAPDPFESKKRLIESLFAEHRELVLGYCRRVLSDPDAAEDATSQTFHNAWRGLDSLKNRDNLRGWLLTIAKRVCGDTFRSRWLAPRPDLSEAVVGEDTSTDAALLALMLPDYLRRLPDEQRIAVKLFYLEGYSYKQVAERMGTDEGRVKSYIQNGVRNLRIEWNGRPNTKGSSATE